MDKEKNKPRWKLTGFDIIIIAVVLVVAAVVFMFLRSSSQTSTTAVSTRSLSYTIELRNMADETAYLIKEGDTIYDSAKKYIMGTVESVTIEPATSAQVDLTTGDTVTSEIPDKLTATIELVCQCTETDTAITATSGYVIRIGAEVQATGPGYAGTGYLVAIEREDS